ncbi:hypothetical protein [Streptomyces sp. NPDC048659]|uniref:hypothetical protein n=1 Tax=Streptomyces sp. NPDC048659 TaxID=3155489 RepID=UPI003413A111
MTRLLKDAQDTKADDITSSTDADTDTDTDTGTDVGTDTDADTGTETGAVATAEEDGAAGTPVPERRRRASWRGAAVVVAVVALLLGGGAFFYGAHELRSTPSAQNRALTDAGATDRVGGDVAEGLARIFSYTPAGTETAERSARTVLTGRAARQYAQLIAQVRANLVAQKITLTTQSVRTGVIELDGDRARVLVFLDQTSRRDGGAVTSAAAQLTVTAQFQDGRWLITDIKAR